MVVLQVELERMKVENHRLKNMLDQVNNNYNALQTHLVSLMKDQMDKEDDKQQPHQVLDGKLEEKRHDIPVFSLGNLLPWYIYNMHEDMGFLWPSSAHTFAIDTHQLSKTINNLVLVERKKNKKVACLMFFY